MKWAQQISECMASNWRARRGPVLLVIARWLAGIGVFAFSLGGNSRQPGRNKNQWTQARKPQLQSQRVKAPLL